MSIVPNVRPPLETLGGGYPTSDGKPMAETELHRDLMFDLIKTLEAFFISSRRVCVSGNLLMFYQKGNKRKHISPDVFVVRGVAKRKRDNYLIWEEGKGPDIVIELTSSSTRHEDMTRKMNLYRDTLQVKEYFLFDPRQDYLKPRLQGFRLREGQYVPITLVDNRLPSQVLKLHLEAVGSQLRLWNPQTETWLPTPDERIEEGAQQLQEAQRVAAEETAARRQLEAELERLRRTLEGGIPPASG